VTNLTVAVHSFADATEMVGTDKAGFDRRVKHAINSWANYLCDSSNF
jgi:hypothetical protein